MPLTYDQIKNGDIPFVAPHNGTDTSKVAAESVKAALGKQRAVVLQLIKDAGPAGRITDEVEEITGGKHQAISARFHDLHTAGLIYCNADDPKDRRPTRSGRLARIYRAIEYKPTAEAAE